MPAPVTVFGPHPLLAVTIERRGESDDLHLHPAGQGVWVARMAGELGADPVLCGFIGGETGKVLQPLLDELPGSRRLVRTAAWSGSYVMDRRSGEREPIAFAWSAAPTRHEIDDLVSLTDDVGARERGAGAVRAGAVGVAAGRGLRQAGRGHPRRRHAHDRRPLTAAAEQRAGG